MTLWPSVKAVTVAEERAPAAHQQHQAEDEEQVVEAGQDVRDAEAQVVARDVEPALALGHLEAKARPRAAPRAELRPSASSMRSSALLPLPASPASADARADEPGRVAALASSAAPRRCPPASRPGSPCAAQLRRQLGTQIRAGRLLDRQLEAHVDAAVAALDQLEQGRREPVRAARAARARSAQQRARRAAHAGALTRARRGDARAARARAPRRAPSPAPGRSGACRPAAAPAPGVRSMRADTSPGSRRGTVQLAHARFSSTSRIASVTTRGRRLVAAEGHRLRLLVPDLGVDRAGPHEADVDVGAVRGRSRARP